MNYDILAISFASLITAAYAVKRYFDDRAEARKVNYVDDLPARLTRYEKALQEAITQVFEFAKATKESELKKTAQAAGVIARVSGRGGMPKP